MILFGAGHRQCSFGKITQVSVQVRAQLNLFTADTSRNICVGPPRKMRLDHSQVMKTACPRFLLIHAIDAEVDRVPVPEDPVVLHVQREGLVEAFVFPSGRDQPLFSRFRWRIPSIRRVNVFQSARC